MDGPVYIRVAKGPLHKIFDQGTGFVLERSYSVTQIRRFSGGKKVAVVTSGGMTHGVQRRLKSSKDLARFTHVHLGC